MTETTGRTAKAEARTQAQRERILAAAEACFVEQGFHAASMAHIAETAEMSAGLIYRYFGSKNEIILAIIERQLELSRREIAALHGSIDLPLDIWESFVQQPGGAATGLNPALYLEMSAAATRDPEIAAAVRSSDRILRTEFVRWLSRSRDKDGMGLPAADAKAVALLIQCVVDGLRVRELREPDVDRKLLKHALLSYLPAWLASEPS